MSVPRPLRATYRLQLHKEFTFDATRKIVPYLAQLGISHVYTSPVLRARPGSTHGYDVADPTEANPELGGERARKRLAAALDDASLGWLLDIVPNHMGTGMANPFWEDVLTHGASSHYARWFDIGWRAPGQPLRGRVLLPVLGDKLRSVVERGELTVVPDDDGRLRIAYFDKSWPVDPATYPMMLARALGGRQKGAKSAPRLSPPMAELAAIAAELSALPGHDERGRAAEGDGRAARADAILARLAKLRRRSPAVRQKAEAAAKGFSRGAAGRERMQALLEAQPYRLAFWRRAARLINYRRFFDINELIGLRMEDPQVFAETHERILEWVEAGEVTGLRIDHIDGLLDPLGYLDQLRAAVTPARGDGSARVPILVEKILSPGERLREEWPVEGTTGYEYLNDLESVFLDADGVREIERGYHAILPRAQRGRLHDFHDVALRGKQRVLSTALSSDVRRLAALLHPVAERDERVADVSRTELAGALVEWIACFPVYRTYIDGRQAPSEADREIVERAALRCRERGTVRGAIVDFLRDLMLDPMAPDRDERLRVVARLQQTSGPATAKGVEDTALYQYVPLVSLNEVGGEPDRPLDDAVRRWHQGNVERARRWPQNLLCTNTHDTKRSADVRARLDVLSEIPGEWLDAVRRWRRANAAHRSETGGRAAPDPNIEYLLYQSLVGIWPLSPDGEAAIPDAETSGELRDRLSKYMEKAMREAKLRTSWTDPNVEFEQGVRKFIDGILPKRGAAKSPFLQDLSVFVAGIARFGLWNSLGRIVGHLCAPGVPDLYQGDELWNFSLVDPDNRRPVDFARRRRLLGELDRQAEKPGAAGALVKNLAARPEDDRLKLWVTRRLLQARRDHEQLFLDGKYTALDVTGPGASHTVAFARRDASGAVAIAAFGRRLRTLAGGGKLLPSPAKWRETRIALPEDRAQRRWTCIIAGNSLQIGRTGGEGGLAVDQLFGDIPVALLLPEADSAIRR